MSVSIGKILSISAVVFVSACKLSVTTTGDGGVVSADESIDCGNVCSASFYENGTVQLSYVESDGYYFSAWEGCSYVEEGICFVDVGLSKSPKVNAIFKPDFMGKIFDLDFEAPVHVVDKPATFGVGSKKVAENYFAFGSPYFAPLISNEFDQFTGQCLVFQSQTSATGTGSVLVGDSMVLPLNYAADEYQIEMDMVLDGIGAGNLPKIMFGWHGPYSTLQFEAAGNISFDGVYIGRFMNGVAFHLQANVDTRSKEVTFLLDGLSVAGPLPFNTEDNDLNSIRFYMFQPLDGEMAVDNVLIQGGWKRDFQLGAEDTEGGYLLDFNSPEITSTYGQDAWGVVPYKENGFNVTGLLRQDPAANTNYPSNGSVHASATFSSRPIIYHENGYGFRLKSLDYAHYSSVVGGKVLIFKGVKRNGDEVVVTVSSSEVTGNFRTLEFGDEWIDLDYVVIDGGLSFDNVVLAVTNEESLFLK